MRSNNRKSRLSDHDVVGGISSFLKNQDISKPVNLRLEGQNYGRRVVKIIKELTATPNLNIKLLDLRNNQLTANEIKVLSEVLNQMSITLVSSTIVKVMGVKSFVLEFQFFEITIVGHHDNVPICQNQQRIILFERLFQSRSNKIIRC